MQPTCPPPHEVICGSQDLLQHHRVEVIVSFFARDFHRHRILQHVVEPTSLPVGPRRLHHPDSFQLLDQRDRSSRRYSEDRSQLRRRQPTPRLHVATRHGLPIAPRHGEFHPLIQGSQSLPCQLEPRLDSPRGGAPTAHVQHSGITQRAGPSHGSRVESPLDCVNRSDRRAQCKTLDENHQRTRMPMPSLRR